MREEMQPDGYEKLLNDFARALRARPDASLGATFDEFWSKLPLAAAGQRRVQIAQALKAVLGDASMVDYVRKYYEVNRDLRNQGDARYRCARADDHRPGAGGYREAQSIAVEQDDLATCSGCALQVLLTVSTPGSLGQVVSRHWLGLLYVFEALIIGGSLLFSAPGARNFGFAALGVTCGISSRKLDYRRSPRCEDSAGSKGLLWDLPPWFCCWRSSAP